MRNQKLSLLIAITLFLTALCLKSNAQKITDSVLKSILKTAATVADMKPIEKLYVQTDKPNYMLGDTIRLKAYLMNADYLTGSQKSGLLYVQFDDESGKMVKRVLFPVVDGLSWGDIILDSIEIPKGNYTLRAYTNWMRNFGEDYIFKKNITVSQHDNNPLLVNTAFKQVDGKIEGEMKFSLLDGRIQAFKNVDLRVVNGKKNLEKNKLITGIDGSAHFNFMLPEATEKTALTIKAQMKGNAEFTLPVTLNRPEETDVQFMPEGGALVAGLPALVGIKAAGEDGKGINIKGTLLNNKGEVIASISTLYKGMGRFTFTPKPGETYIAKVDGINKTYPLPAVNANGTGLSVSSVKDSLNVQVSFTPTNGRSNSYYLIAQARNIVCYAQTLLFENSASIAKSIPNSLFPTGIVHFTLLNSAYLPVNERIVFVNHQDQLNIKVNTEKPTYGLRDSVAISLKVTDKNGKPVTGSFSIAVTDDSQVKTDSLGNNIFNSLLLTSDLKGDVEDPGYYFIGNKEPELDNLMLTQGWVGYDWKDIIYPKYPLPFSAETEFTVKGRVVNAFNKPVEKSSVILFAPRPQLIVMDTLTDHEGKFKFSGIFPVDTAIFKIQARNKRNKEFNIGIEMDIVKPPDFTSTTHLQPWYANTDTTLLKNIKVKIQETQAQSLYSGEGQVLNEVSIKAKKFVAGSKNLNGPGGADQIIDEEELKKADTKTLSDLLREKIKGFVDYGLWSRTCFGCKSVPMPYVLNGKLLHFVFDGIDIDKFNDGAIKREHYIKNFLDYYTAEDVTGIEIMYNMKFAGNYFNGGFADSPQDHAYIEITTRTKHGPFMKVTPGTYLYKALAFTLPKQFYRPRYTIQNKSAAQGTDMRSTIHWEPNIITDASGNATFSFYSADKTGNYTLIIEGADLNGQIGYERKKIKVIK